MNNSTYMNLSDDSSCTNAVSIFFTTSMAINSLAAFTGNILVIASVYRTPSLRTSANYYYVNMAVSDFICSLTTWPLYLTNEIITSRGSLIQGSLATAGCKVGTYFRMTSAIVSILSLVLIAVDRFIATVFPFKVTLITWKTRAVLLFATWLISMGYCIPMFYYFKAEKVGQETFCRFAWNDFSEMIYNLTGLTLFEVIPFLLIIIIYSRIIRVLNRRPNSADNTGGCSNTQERRNKQNKNIMKIFKSIVAAYFISFFLYLVYLILKITFPKVFIKDKCKWILGFAYFVFPSVSAAINPVILFSFSTNFREALPDLCHCTWISKFHSCCKAEGTSPHQPDESLPKLKAFKETEC